MKKIENVVSAVLTGDAQKNAAGLIAHMRACGEVFGVTQNDEKDETGWAVENLGFIFINGGEDFPGPWTMWLNADNLGAGTKLPVDDSLKEFAWAHVSPCGSCGGSCSPGVSAKVFGRDFENTCQTNLMFVNPGAEAIGHMKKIIDIKKEELAQ